MNGLKHSCEKGRQASMTPPMVEALESRRLMSGAGAGRIVFPDGLPETLTPPSSHHHYHLRHHYHSPHTVTPDILFGHFVGTTTRTSFLDTKVELTLGKDVSGKLNGLLLLHGFRFDMDFTVTVYSDEVFYLVGLGNNKSGGVHWLYYGGPDPHDHA